MSHRARWLRHPAAAAILASLVAVGCSKPESGGASPIDLAWRLDPSPARIGAATVHFTLRDAIADEPVKGASVHIEGNMSHPGMAPSLADAHEVKPGAYEAPIRFTMGGDWYLLFDIRLADGTQVQRHVDVPGVRTR